MSLSDPSTQLRDGLSQVALILFAAFALANTVGAQDDLQPYTVYVDQEGVTARCGPGADYYRTDPLRHGQPLEVYVETENGWLGIRPPEGSFCWLPADVVKLSPRQEFGIVSEENSLAWIGTHLGKANKYLWQVQLAKGEEVAIVGRAKREGPDGMKLWYRIVPPAGEFRWVHRDQVVDNPELLLREKPRPGSRLATGRPTPAPEPAEIAEATYDEPARAPRRRSPEPASVIDSRRLSRAEDQHPDNEPLHPSVTSEDAQPLPLPTPQPEPRMVASPAPISPPVVNEQPIGSGVVYDDTVNRAYEAPLVAFTTSPRIAAIGTPYTQTDSAPLDTAPPTEQLADAFQQRVGANPIAATNLARNNEQQLYVDRSRVTIQSTVVPASNVVPVTQPKPELTQNADAIQLELSRLMSRSAAASEVEPIIAAANSLANSGGTESERQRAALILQRAQQYQMIARRRDVNSPTLPPSAIAPLSYPSPVQAFDIQTVPIETGAESGKNVAGYLVQVFSSRPDSPPYALTDNQGRTTHYISAAPGVNLRRYLNQMVTIRGTAGYSTGLDTPHVIATGAVRQ